MSYSISDFPSDFEALWSEADHRCILFPPVTNTPLLVALDQPATNGTGDIVVVDRHRNGWVISSRDWKRLSPENSLAAISLGLTKEVAMQELETAWKDYPTG